MGLFKKKLSDEELIKKNIESQQAELEEKEAAKNKKGDDLGDSKLGVEITKIKAQLEGLNEQRQAVNERFSRISEEIGEIRGMGMDTNKAVGNIEASATKASVTRCIERCQDAGTASEREVPRAWLPTVR